MNDWLLGWSFVAVWESLGWAVIQHGARFLFHWQHAEGGGRDHQTSVRRILRWQNKVSHDKSKQLRNEEDVHQESQRVWYFHDPATVGSGWSTSRPAFWIIPWALLILCQPSQGTDVIWPTNRQLAVRSMWIDNYLIGLLGIINHPIGRMDGILLEEEEVTIELEMHSIRIHSHNNTRSLVAPTLHRTPARHTHGPSHRTTR